LTQVLLELPLNHLTFMAVGREIGTLVGVAKPGPSSG